REILKSDEAGITESTIEINDSLFDENGAFVNDNYILPAEDESAKKLYIDRYLNFFGPNALEGKNIGLYGHSAVGRDIIFEILTNLGAKVSKLDYSDHFIPVDTEMVSEEMAAKGKEWNNNYHFDCLVTTDGDSDRPLLADEEGSWCRADTTGIMVGKYLGIKTIVAPIGCNTALEKSKTFENISRTKIGSPYVVEEMMRVKDKGLVPVAGYEANGGFLLGTEVNKNGKILKALATRDAIIVHLAIIMLAKENGTTIKEMTSQLPKRFTQSLSLKGFPTELSLKIIEKLSGGTFEEQKEKIQRDTGNVFGQVKSVDLTDGLRITFENEDIVHFRPSQNSPEFRSYVESGSQERADKLAKQALDIIEGWMNKPTN
ncbi:MAG TPA: phosphomannomutase, partial [Patescibacteria group bacterium]